MNNKAETISSVVRAFYPRTYAKWLNTTTAFVLLTLLS
jgi:hypothetical protein